MASAVNIALPTIGKELSMDAVQLSWVATAYLLIAGMFLLPFGRIADIHGRKRMFTIGIIIFTVASLLNSLATSGLMLISFRLLQGFGASMMFGLGIAILTSVFPPEERGKVLGYNVAAVYLGLSVGPFAGGLLTHHFGWRSVFLTNIPLGIMILVVSLWKLKGEWSDAKGERFDISGSVIYSLMLVAVIYGFTLLPAANGGVLLLLGMVGLVAFVAWESRTKSPLLEMHLFRRNTVFAFSNLATLISYCATAAVTFLLSLYFQYNMGLSAQDAGVILITQPIVQAVFSPLAGRLSDKVEPRIVASAGMAFTVFGLLMLTFIGNVTSISYLLISLGLLGFGIALFSSPNTNAVMSSVEKRSYGVASATLGTMRITGQMLSMAIVMLLVSTFIGPTQITPGHYDEFLHVVKVAFSIFTVLCIIGIFASLARGKVRKGS
jgi:EmrB/QacA subfamily drug resistance transporter